MVVLAVVGAVFLWGAAIGVLLSLFAGGGDVA